MTDSKQELKPCPFCGEPGTVVCDGEGLGAMFYVACGGANCFCCLGEGYDGDAMPSHTFRERAKAIAAWNTRPADLTGELVEALRRCSIAFGALYPSTLIIGRNENNENEEIAVAALRAQIDAALAKVDAAKEGK